jgi:hypothetical protein
MEKSHQHHMLGVLKFDEHIVTRFT